MNGHAGMIITNGVNLLSPSRRYAAKIRARATLWGVILAVYVIAALGVGASFALSVSHAAQNDLTGADRIRLRIEKAEKQLAEARAQRESAIRALEVGRAVGVHPDWSLLLAALGRQCGDSVVLDRVELSTAPLVPPSSSPAPKQRNKPTAEPPASRHVVEYTLKVGGLASSQAAVSSFVTALEGLGVFDSVLRAEARSRSDDKTKLVAFEVRCTARESITPRPDTAKGAKP